MVRTLIHHELHRTRKPLAALLGFSTLGVLGSFLLAITGWPVISAVAAVVSLIITGAFLIVLVLGIAVDLYQSSFGRRGYLTHALPIQGSTIMWTKLAYSIIVILVGILWYVAGITMTILAMQVSAGTPLGEAWSALTAQVSAFMDTVPTWLLLAIIAMVLLMVLAYVAQVYFAVSVGSEKRFHGMQAGGPVLLYALVYLVIQLVLVIGIALVPFGLAFTGGELRLTTFQVGALFTSSGPDEIIPLGFIPALALLCALLLWRTVISWQSRVALR